MSKSYVKNFIKRGLLATLVVGVTLIVYGVLTTKSTPSSGLPEDADTMDMYDDKEFYHLTHNTNGTLNDYGHFLSD